MVIFMGKKIHSIEEEKFIKAFGDKVRSLREKYNITQSELADRMDMSTQTLSDIENGKSDCQHSTSFLIAKAFGIEIHQLYMFEDE